MIGIYIGFGLMTVAAVAALILNRRLLRRQGELLADINKLYDERGELKKRLFRDSYDYTTAIQNEAKMREIKDRWATRFEVYFQGFEDYVIRRFWYFNDDDREYKRICAEELVEKLNEEV